MARRQARLVAVEVLYAADMRGVAPDAVLSERADASPYAEHLVLGVQSRRGAIDDLLRRYARDWPPERMSAVDRNVLRIGVLELLEGDVPVAVVIDEAVVLAKRFSGDEAGRFVNGVLAGITRSAQSPAANGSPSDS